MRAVGTAGLRAWPSRRWSRYFRHNARVPSDVPWHLGDGLTEAERVWLGPSLRVFQQGEAQEGAHFYRCARAHAERSGDFDYAEAHRLFMAEEHRHGRDLAQFLGLAGFAPLTQRSWLAWGFCWFGSRGGLETILLVVLMSEVVAQVYYRSVWSASQSPVLRRLCARILRDEKAHVRFQCQQLVKLRRGRPDWLLTTQRLLDRLLFAGAALACWLGHRRALEEGGRAWAGFWREGWEKFGRAEVMKEPRNYALDESTPELVTRRP